MSRKILSILFILVLSTFTFAQNKSIYTDITDVKCKTLNVNQGMPGNYSSECAGVGGYKLAVYLDDERNSIGVISPKQKVYNLEFWSFFGGFSALGEKAEWRVRGKAPVALIIRLKVNENSGDSVKVVSYLLVSKITKTTACVTDIVKPGKNQNILAQKMADLALNKSCKRINPE